MTVQWRNFRSNDLVTPFSLEETFHRYGSWGGIHDFKFRSLIESSDVPVTGITADDWTYSANIDVDLPANFTLKYHKTEVRQWVVISGGSGAVFLIVGTDDNGYPTIYNSNTNIVQMVPKDTPEEADVEIVFRQQTFSDTDQVVWRSVTMYMNGAWITTYSNQLFEATAPLRIGFAAWDTDIVDYTDVHVPELCETTEAATLDAGAPAMTNLQQTMEGRYLKYFIRFDGSLTAWRLKQRDNVMTIDGDIKSMQKPVDLVQLITHARMMGAYVWAEDRDIPLMQAYGHRFQEVNNSMLLTPSECQEEATNTLKRSQESAFRIQIPARNIPILEPEDRVIIDDEDWIISSYSISAMLNKTLQIVQNYEGRTYVWG